MQGPDARMHLSLDTMSMVDDSCLSPSNFHELGKGGGIAAGGRVHSIDVILGFSKDQDPLLSPAGAQRSNKVDIDCLAEPGKQQEPSSHPTYSGHLSSLRNGSTEQQYHGESSCWCWGCWSPSWQSFLQYHHILVHLVLHPPAGINFILDDSLVSADLASEFDFVSEDKVYES